MLDSPVESAASAVTVETLSFGVFRCPFDPFILGRKRHRLVQLSRLETHDRIRQNNNKVQDTRCRASFPDCRASFPDCRKMRESLLLSHTTTGCPSAEHDMSQGVYRPTRVLEILSDLLYLSHDVHDEAGNSKKVKMNVLPVMQG